MNVSVFVAEGYDWSARGVASTEREVAETIYDGGGSPVDEVLMKSARVK